MIVIDTSVIVAYMNATDDHHEQVSSWLEDVDDDLATTPLIVAEVDHLVAARGGRSALSAWRTDLADGAYLVEWWQSAIGSAVNIAERYAANRLGLTDASLVRFFPEPHREQPPAEGSVVDSGHGSAGLGARAGGGVAVRSWPPAESRRASGR